MGTINAEQYFLMRPAQDITELKNTSVSGRADGLIRQVNSKGVYTYDSNYSGPYDDSENVKPATGAGGWRRKTGIVVKNDPTLVDASQEDTVSEYAIKQYVDSLDYSVYWQDPVIDEIDFTSAEPASPILGDRYINTTTGTSSITAQDITANYIYQWSGTIWAETVPLEGMLTYVDTEDRYKLFSSTNQWVYLSGVQTFIDLSDSPAGYVTPYAIYRVNVGLDGIEESGATIDATGKLSIDSLSLATGATINDITIDGTLATASDTQIGTTEALKAYVDSQSHTGIDQAQIYYVSSVGADTNDGLTLDKAFATFEKGVAEAILQTPTASNRYVVCCQDAGDFLIVAKLTIPSYVGIYAPNANIDGEFLGEDDSFLIIRNWTTSDPAPQLFYKTTGVGTCFIDYNEIDFPVLGTTAIRCDSGTIVVKAKKLVASSGVALWSTANGQIRADIDYINTNTVGIRTDGSGNIYLKTQSLLSTDIAILMFGGEIHVQSQEVIATRAYDVAIGATLYLTTDTISGTEVNLGTLRKLNIGANSKISGLELATGAIIDDITIDTTLATASNTQIGTTEALKAYVDSQSHDFATSWQAPILDAIDFTTAEPATPTIGLRYINTVTGLSSVTSQSVTSNYIYEGNGISWDEQIPIEGFALYNTSVSTFWLYNSALAWADFDTVLTFLGLQQTPSAFSAPDSIYKVSSIGDAIQESSGTISDLGALKVSSVALTTGAIIDDITTDGTLATASDTEGLTSLAAKTYVNSHSSIERDWQDSISDELDFTTSEPGAPVIGNRYSNTVTGISSITAQSVTATYIYTWNGVDWTERSSLEGMVVYVKDEETYKWFNSSSQWVALHPEGLTALVDDTDPHLGGDLIVNGHKITEDINVDVNIESSGTGNANMYSTGSGNVSFDASGSGNINLNLTGTGNVELNSIIYPKTDGSSGQVMYTDGAGTLGFKNDSGGIDQAQIYYVSAIGLDTNNGKTLETAFATFAKGITEAVAQSPSSSNEFVIYCQDANVYDLGTSLVDLPSYISIYVPSALIIGGFDVQDFTSVIISNIIVPPTHDGAILKSTGSGEAYINIKHIEGAPVNHCVKAESGKLRLNIESINIDSTYGVWTTGSGDIQGVVGSIYSPSGDTGIRNEGGEIEIKCNEIHSVGGTGIDVISGVVICECQVLNGTNAYNNAGFLYLQSDVIVGNEINTGTLNTLVLSGNSQMHSMDLSDGISAKGGAVLNSLTYPVSDGTVNQIMYTNGTGTIGFKDEAGGGGVDENNIIYVGKHGNDANDGLNIEKAKLTFVSALAAASVGDAVVCLDGGTYSDNFSIPADMTVFAQNAIVTGQIQVNDRSVIHLYKLVSSGGTTIFSPSLNAEPVLNIEYIEFSGNANISANFGGMIINTKSFTGTSTLDMITVNTGHFLLNAEDISLAGSLTFIKILGGASESFINAKEINLSFSSTIPFNVTGGGCFVNCDLFYAVSPGNVFATTGVNGRFRISSKHPIDGKHTGVGLYEEFDFSYVQPKDNLLIGGNYATTPWYLGESFTDATDASYATSSTVFLTNRPSVTGIDISKSATDGSLEILTNASATFAVGVYEKLSFADTIKLREKDITFTLRAKSNFLITSFTIYILSYAGTNNITPDDPISVWGTPITPASGFSILGSSTSTLTTSYSDFIVSGECPANSTSICVLVVASTPFIANDTINISDIKLEESTKFTGYKIRDEAWYAKRRCASSYADGEYPSASPRNSGAQAIFSYTGEDLDMTFGYERRLDGFPITGDISTYSTNDGALGNVYNEDIASNFTIDGILGQSESSHRIYIDNIFGSATYSCHYRVHCKLTNGGGVQ